jgi:hypothetical protein
MKLLSPVFNMMIVLLLLEGRKSTNQFLNLERMVLSLTPESSLKDYLSCCVIEEKNLKLQLHSMNDTRDKLGYDLLEREYIKLLGRHDLRLFVLTKI